MMPGETVGFLDSVFCNDKRHIESQLFKFGAHRCGHKILPYFNKEFLIFIFIFKR